jgi:ATP-dependent Lon protease
VAGEVKGSVTVDPAQVAELLGVPRYHRPGETRRKSEVGAATGLAWTEVGGELLTIEATLMRGRGRLTLTGQLGDVMQESAQAAMSYIRGRSDELGIDPLFYRKYDIHVHLPEGAIPKDGPSAGIALATALASLFSKVPVRGDVAMTGEITLRGKVLPIGGVKEKTLAAYRFGIKTVILPKENEKDLSEIPEDISKQLDFRLVENMDEVLETALAESLPSLTLGKDESEERLDDASADGSVTH